MPVDFEPFLRGEGGGDFRGINAGESGLKSVEF